MVNRLSLDARADLSKLIYLQLQHLQRRADMYRASLCHVPFQAKPACFYCTQHPCLSPVSASLKLIVWTAESAEAGETVAWETKP